MSLRRGHLAIAVASALLAGAGCEGCRRSQRVEREGVVDASLATASPRCTLLPTAVSLPTDIVDVGVARTQGTTLIVGVTQRTGDLRRAALVRFEAESGQLTVVPLGAQHDDDLPPRAAFGAGGKNVVAVFVSADSEAKPTKGDEGSPGALVVGRIDGAAFTAIGKPLHGIRPASSFDLAERDGVLLLAATSDAAHENRVVVTDVRTGTTVSSITSDAPFVEELALRAEGAGFALAWAGLRVHGEDAGAGAGAGDRAEGPGIERSDRWVEGTKLDPKGACAKQPCVAVRLSKTSGHVGAFELPTSSASDVQAIYFRDDEERHAGQGSEVYVRKWGSMLPEAPQSVRAGVGVRAFDALSPTLLAYTNVNEEVRIALGTDGGSGADWPSVDAGGIDIQDGLLSRDVRLLAVLPPLGKAASMRLLAMRGREIIQLSCTP